MRSVLYCVAFLWLAFGGAALGAQNDGAKDHGAKPHGAKPQAAETKEEVPEEAPEEPLEAEPGSPVPEQPYQLVRTLERVQDRISEGNSQAHGFQRQFITDLGAKLRAMPDKVWRQPKNIRSAMVYVLSGGDPQMLGKLINMKGLPDTTKTLARGVRAYSEGRNREALRFLSDVDHRSFDTRTGCHIALAKAMVTAQEDAPKAIDFLDDARLLCPGTLVEEAALRREVLLLANAEDFPRFELLVSQYLRRFPKSVYARSFIHSLAIAVVTGKYSTDPILRARFVDMVDLFAEETRRQVYIAVAEQAVIRGKVEITRIATRKALALLPPDSRDATRMTLYEAAAQVVTPEYDAALTRLKAIDRRKLSASDTQLLDNALALAAEVRQPLKETAPNATLPPLSSATQVKYGAIAEKSEALDNLRQALARADALLKEKR